MTFVASPSGYDFGASHITLVLLASERFERIWTELRYASDLTDAERAPIEPFMPPAKVLGRPRSTGQRYVCAWRDEDVCQRINHHLVMAAREAEGREAAASRPILSGASNLSFI